MIVVDDFLVSITFDLVAILIILGLCMIPGKSGEKNDSGAKIFTGMGSCVIAGAVLDIISFSGVLGDYLSLIIAVSTLAEVFTIGFMFLLLLYTDYVFYGSRDHLRRHFAAYLAPFAFIAVIVIVNAFAGILYTPVADDVVTPTALYYVVGIVEYLYLFIPAVYFLMCFIKSGAPRFFHPLSICIPIICGVVLTAVTPFSVEDPGFAVGLAFLTFSRIDSRRYIDEETGFYNRAYLEYVLRMINDKKGTYKGMISADIAGDRIAFSRVLKEELPGGSEVVVIDKGRFVCLADTGNMTDLKTVASLINLGAQEYDEEHHEKIHLREAVCSSFGDDEAIKTAIATLTGSGNTDRSQGENRTL